MLRASGGSSLKAVGCSPETAGLRSASLVPAKVRVHDVELVPCGCS